MYPPRAPTTPEPPVGVPSPLGWLAALLLLPWFASRAGWLSLGAANPEPLGLTVDGMLFPFLFIDWNWIFLVPAVTLWSWAPPSRAQAALSMGMMATAGFFTLLARSLYQYWSGQATAWDLANFTQPMWRFLHGGGLRSTWHGGRPLWGDHGSFTFFAFAPLTGLGDGIEPLLVAQALLVALFLPAAYGCARSLGAGRATSCMIACVAGASRPLENAAAFDFHPECLLPLALALLVWAHRSGRLGVCAAVALVAALTKDIAALTAGMTLLYLAVVERAGRRTALALGGGALAIAALDIFVLPSLTGWYSYVKMNTSAPIDWGLAARTTALRAATSAGLPWIHPYTWIAGGPWVAAAALSPKLMVKGVIHQYSFFFVPVAVLGAAMLAAALQRRYPQVTQRLVPAWTLLAVALNGPREVPPRELLRAARDYHRQQMQLLERSGLSDARAPVAADNCSAPYVIRKPTLLPLCYVDFDLLAQTGIERMDVPRPDSVDAANWIVARLDCAVQLPCLDAQLRRAAERGFRVVARAGNLLVLRR